MAQLVYNFEKVKEKWEGKKNGDYTVPELILETPGEHEYDENTRYSVTMLETNGQAMHKGIKVSVLEEGRCDTREDKPGTQENSDDTGNQLAIIKGWWYNDQGAFMFNLEKEMNDCSNDFKVEKDGTVRVKWDNKTDMIIRIIDNDHIAYRFTGKEETQEKTLTRGEKPSWAN